MKFVSRFVSGADGIGDTEGKVATGSGERAGRQASFKFVSRLCNQKKACHSFTHPINLGNHKKEKSVDAFLAFQLKAAFSHLNSIHIVITIHS